VDLEIVGVDGAGGVDGDVAGGPAGVDLGVVADPGRDLVGDRREGDAGGDAGHAGDADRDTERITGGERRKRIGAGGGDCTAAGQCVGVSADLGEVADDRLGRTVDRRRAHRRAGGDEAGGDVDTVDDEVIDGRVRGDIDVAESGDLGAVEVGRPLVRRDV